MTATHNASNRTALEDMLSRYGFTTPPEAGFGVPPRHCTLSWCAARLWLVQVPR